MNHTKTHSMKHSMKHSMNHTKTHNTMKTTKNRRLCSKEKDIQHQSDHASDSEQSKYSELLPFKRAGRERANIWDSIFISMLHATERDYDSLQGYPRSTMLSLLKKIDSIESNMKSLSHAAQLDYTRSKETIMTYIKKGDFTKPCREGNALDSIVDTLKQHTHGEEHVQESVRKKQKKTSHIEDDTENIKKKRGKARGKEWDFLDDIDPRLYPFVTKELKYRTKMHGLVKIVQEYQHASDSIHGNNDFKHGQHKCVTTKLSLPIVL